MSDEIQLLRELRADAPDLDDRAIRRIYDRATAPPSRFAPAPGSRSVVAVVAAVAAVAVAVSLPILLAGNAGRRPSHSAVSSTSSSAGPPKAPLSSLAVSSAADAANLVPFTIVLPSNATPTEMQVSDPQKTPAAGAWFSAQFDTTSAGGSYQLFERASSATVTTLQGWTQDSTSCSGCTIDEVVTEDGVHVAVFASPVLGLQLYWVRGDGTGGVLSQLVWASGTFNEQAALSVAGDMISQSG